MAPSPRPHLLVVDDDPGVREGLATALGTDYTVHTAATGAAARRALQTHPIALIILDAILGDEHGLDLVPQLRACTTAPIILLTGYSTEELAIRALNSHVDAYLKKPVDISAFCGAVERVLGRAEDVLARARRYLDEHLEKPLRLGALASQLGMSEAHLRRRFRAVYGLTPRQYLLRARLIRARELLETTGADVKQVAQDAGLANLVMFRRLFRRAFGCSPRAVQVRPQAGVIPRPTGPLSNS